MALIELKIYSEVLGTPTEVNVVMPQPNEKTDPDKNLKCLYLLHGIADDHTTWIRRTSIERYAEQYGICVVMPYAYRSFYTDMKYGGKYYTYIIKELPQIIRGFFNISDKREDNFIAGLSMGGYGALKIGLLECEGFSAAAGLSSVADIVDCKKHFEKTYIPIFGEDAVIPDDCDLFKLASKKNNDPLRPRIFMGVGTEDFLYEGNIALKKHFESLDYDFTYRESAGVHNWAFWDEYIQYVLKWMFG